MVDVTFLCRTLPELDALTEAITLFIWDVTEGRTRAQMSLKGKVQSPCSR